MIKLIDQLLLIGQNEAAAILIKDAIIKGIHLEGKHIAYANALLLCCDWEKTVSIMPKDTNSFVTSGWLNSLAQRRPVNNNNEPIPWLTYPAIDFLDSIVKPDWKTFEWGSGNSTLWWASKVESVVAIEDNTVWYNEINSKMPGNAFVFNKVNKAEYVNAIASYNDNGFDVIVIDGSHRNDCTRASISKLKDSGIIVFDNSDGIEYDASMLFLNENGFLRIDYWGLIPSYMYKNCTSVFFKDPFLFKNLINPSQHISSVGISCYQAIEKNKQPEKKGIIPPEIYNDEFYHAIKHLASTENLDTVLEIGSSSGEGSTEAFVSGFIKNPHKPSFFCMEISKTRFEALKHLYSSYDFVHCYNVSSVPLSALPTEEDVRFFYTHTKTLLNNFPIELVLSWLREGVKEISASGVQQNGISFIKQEHDISTFDLVLIDGSEFTGKAELEEIYGARFILLDDINAFKNYENYHRLVNDPDYTLVAENWNLRNGYAIFKRTSHH